MCSWLLLANEFEAFEQLVAVVLVVQYKLQSKKNN